MDVTLPTGHAGRALALGLILFLAAVLWFGAVTPLIEWYGQRAEMVARKQVLSRRMETIAASLPAWEKTLSGAAARTPARAVLLAETSDALAAAALQGLVRDMIGRAGAQVSSMEILTTEPRPPYRRIAVRVVAEGSYPVLLAVLRAVGEASPRMLVDGLSLRGPDARTLTDAPPLAATFNVLAFRAADSGAKP